MKTGRWTLKRIATYIETKSFSDENFLLSVYGRTTDALDTGARRMPWHREAKKDAEDCDNPRGAVNGL